MLNENEEVCEEQQGDTLEVSVEEKITAKPVFGGQ